MAAYASSKALAVMFTKCLGLELAEYNIRAILYLPDQRKQTCSGHYGPMKMERSKS